MSFDDDKTDNAGPKQTTLPVDETPEKESCPLCHAEPIVLTLGVVTSACGLIADPKKREDCSAWARNLKPGQISSAVEIARGLLQRTDDVEELDNTVKMLNNVNRQAIIEEVTYRMENNIPIPDRMMASYKNYMLKGGLK